MMKTGPKGIALIKEFEGFRGDAYADPVGIWTIGYGSTHGVEPGQSITEAEASARLVRELVMYEKSVWNACSLQPNQHEFGAMVSLCYNIGPANFKKSSVLRAHNAGDSQAAARAFSLWNRAGGRVFKGLTRRRAAEAALYLEPEREFGRDAMPQQVDPERPMTASTINRASIAAGGTTALAATVEVAHQVNTVKNLTEDLGAWLVPGLLVLVLALLGYIVWERVKQRQGGWA